MSCISWHGESTTGENGCLTAAWESFLIVLCFSVYSSSCLRAFSFFFPPSHRFPFVLIVHKIHRVSWVCHEPDSTQFTPQVSVWILLFCLLFKTFEMGPFTLTVFVSKPFGCMDCSGLENTTVCLCLDTLSLVINVFLCGEQHCITDAKVFILWSIFF